MKWQSCLIKNVFECDVLKALNLEGWQCKAIFRCVHENGVAYIRKLHLQPSVF